MPTLLGGGGGGSTSRGGSDSADASKQKSKTASQSIATKVAANRQRGIRKCRRCWVAAAVGVLVGVAATAPMQANKKARLRRNQLLQKLLRTDKGGYASADVVGWRRRWEY